jgi:hypothetical protein
MSREHRAKSEAQAARREFGLFHLLACLLVLMLCVSPFASCFAAAPFSTRADSKKPLGPESEKALAKLADDGREGKKAQLTKQMEWAVDLMGKAVEISPDEKAALLDDAQDVVEEALRAWRPRYIESMRFYLASYTDDAAAARRVEQWKMDQAEKRLTIEGWTLPDLLPSWQEAVKRRLGEERGAKALAAREAQRAEVKGAMKKFLERWASTGRVPMDEELRVLIESLRKELKPAQDKVDALFAAAKKLVDDHAASETTAGEDLLSSLTEDQRVVTMGQGNSFSTRFVRPKGADLEKKWTEIAAKTLGEEPVRNWQKIVAEQKAKHETELVDSLKPSEMQARIQMEELIAREVDSYAGALDLDDERKKKLEALAGQAVDASIEASRKEWIKTIQGWSAAERQGRRNIYFGVNEENQAPKQTVWTEGLKKLFTEEEKRRMEEGVAARRTRLVGALTASTLAEMDKTLALGVTQRAALEPLLRPLIEPLLRDDAHEYWSYQPYQLFNAAAKLPEEKLKPVLDESQLRQWKLLGAAQPNYDRGSGVSAPSGEPDPEAARPDVETEISNHLHQLAVKERQKQMDLMMARVGDARRVLNLPEDKVRRLITAAKGAVEAEMTPWRDNVERWVRGTVERATPHTVRATLANLARSNYNIQGKGPHRQDIWRETLAALLSPSEQTEWGKVLEARHDYRCVAIASMTANELDRRRRLTPEQLEKVRQLVIAVLHDYLPDIERYMSHTWHLQYYYALLPLAGVKDDDLKAALNERQWKLVQERDLADAEQYWEGIESYHKQRVEKGGDAEESPMLFFDE